MMKLSFHEKSLADQLTHLILIMFNILVLRCSPLWSILITVHYFLLEIHFWQSRTFLAISRVDADSSPCCCPFYFGIFNSLSRLLIYYPV